ncbi:GIY-YIG nuclease family protein [Rhodanobacter ginsengiterrae]|uniref:GIY-YIG nuclease family protein n=1 Tax=Rhodanobacter ginsengiterrae TaxID=2008451 RepID=UPI003CFB1ED0
MVDDAESAGYPRFATRGRTFVYLLPCRDEDILKIGFSRDPLQRMHALHRRYFDFFDLERALLIETERLSEARRIERTLIRRFAEHRSPAPLVVRDAAAGYTEWFRGVAGQAEALARGIAAEEGWPLHAPLSSWLQRLFHDRADAFHDWSARLLDSIEYERFNLPAEAQRPDTARVLRTLLDACAAVNLEVAALVPARVVAWYRSDGFH